MPCSLFLQRETITSNKARMQVVKVEDARLRALENPRSMSCEAQLARVVRALVASPNGRWAALVMPHAVHVFDIAAAKYHGQLPLPQVGLARFWVSSFCLAF